jgi:hypothetical protein
MLLIVPFIGNEQEPAVAIFQQEATNHHQRTTITVVKFRPNNRHCYTKATLTKA